MNRDKHIKLALDEDCCRQDVTTKLLPIHKKCKAIIKIKETSHVYGIRWLEQVFKQIDKKIKIKFNIKDGHYKNYPTSFFMRVLSCLGEFDLYLQASTARSNKDLD